MPDILWFLLIGLIAGWLAGLIMRGRGFGFIGDIVIGIVGALIGGFLFGLIGVGTGGLIGSIITATIGAVILLAIASLFKRGSTHSATH